MVKRIETEIYESDNLAMTTTSIYNDDAQINRQILVLDKETGQIVTLDDVWDIPWEHRDTTTLVLNDAPKNKKTPLEKE